MPQKTHFIYRGSIADMFSDTAVWKRIKTIIDDINGNVVVEYVCEETLKGGYQMKIYYGDSELNQWAAAFRHAINKAKDSGEASAFFRGFPAGQCGVTSIMLAQFLRNMGVVDMYYICGNFSDELRNQVQSHAWLDINGTVIDITGDQFKDRKDLIKNENPIYVGPVNDYYRLFEVDASMCRPCYGLLSKVNCGARIRKDYETVMKYINIS